MLSKKLEIHAMQQMTAQRDNSQYSSSSSLSLTTSQTIERIRREVESSSLVPFRIRHRSEILNEKRKIKFKRKLYEASIPHTHTLTFLPRRSVAVSGSVIIPRASSSFISFHFYSVINSMTICEFNDLNMLYDDMYKSIFIFFSSFPLIIK